jgi:hypothetical protein
MLMYPGVLKTIFDMLPDQKPASRHSRIPVYQQEQEPTQSFAFIKLSKSLLRLDRPWQHLTFLSFAV